MEERGRLPSTGLQRVGHDWTTSFLFFFFFSGAGWLEECIRCHLYPFPNTLATWCEKLTHRKRPWCWERLGAGEEGDDRGWDGWMASPTRWTWLWASSGNWWWTGKPAMLQSLGSQRVGHDWVTELNCTLSLKTQTKTTILQFPSYPNYLGLTTLGIWSELRCKWKAKGNLINKL